MNFKRWLFTGIVIALSPTARMVAQEFPNSVVNKVQSATAMKNGCHPLTIEGKDYVVCIDNGKIETIRRNVIPNPIRQCDDSVYMKFIEEAYASVQLESPSPRFSDIDIMKGTWASLDKLDENVRCETKHDKKGFTVSLYEGETLLFSLWSPINYQKFHAGTRTEIESRFIKGLLHFEPNPMTNAPAILPTELRSLADSIIYSLPGDSYLRKHINNDTYVAKNEDGSYEFIVNPQQPLATMANMMILGIGYQAMLDMTISTHAYGSAEKMTVSLEQFRQYCIHSGCKPFWVVESYESDELKGSLFCHNEREGYEHIIRLTCHPSQLGTEDFRINAKASLFIPTTNTIVE